MNGRGTWVPRAGRDGEKTKQQAPGRGGVLIGCLRFNWARDSPQPTADCTWLQAPSLSQTPTVVCSAFSSSVETPSFFRAVGCVSKSVGPTLRSRFHHRSSLANDSTYTPTGSAAIDVGNSDPGTSMSRTPAVAGGNRVAMG
jgi:hypothetical protein